MSIMIGSLFEQVWKWISAGTEKLVAHVLNFVIATGHSVSKGVSEGLSRLRNIWTLLKASISATIANFKESCLEGIRILMKPILQLAKWLADQVVELMAWFARWCKTDEKEFRKDNGFGTGQSSSSGVDVKLEPGAGGIKKGGVNGVDILTSSATASCVIQLIRLFGKHMNTTILAGVKLDAMVDIAHDVIMVVSSFMKIASVFV